jgi:hypothetical protein
MVFLLNASQTAAGLATGLSRGLRSGLSGTGGGIIRLPLLKLLPGKGSWWACWAVSLPDSTVAQAPKALTTQRLIFW